MPILFYSIIAVVLLATALLYFKIADKFGIVDNPNNRSSHTGSIIRGGGVIFFIALLCWFVYSELAWPFFMAGITLVAIISFIDDIKPQRTLVRFTIHLLAVALMFYQASVYDWPVWLVIIAAIVCIGTINAFNFMDGINGITGVYALVNLGSFLFINEYVTPFSNTQLIIIAGISVIIFLVFNFRKRAKCFAGDVGSVTLAFLQIFLLLQLIHTTGNYFWVIMFLVYGIDSSITILYRLSRKENIFRAHRTHLYQYLSNELKLQHRIVSLFYGIIQLVLNIILIQFLPESYLIPLISSVVFIALYVIARINVMKKIRVQQV